MNDVVLFSKKGDVYQPSVLAGSPWHCELLHGGAPAGLLAHCLEQSVANPAMQPARLNIDLIRPVPCQPLQVRLRRIRQGKKIILEEAQLFSNDKVVAIATALFVAQHPIQVPVDAPAIEPMLPLPTNLQTIDFNKVLFTKNVDVPPGLHTTVLLKPVSRLSETGSGKAWLQLPALIVEGQPNSPFMLAALMSDFANGVGQLSIDADTGMINADIHLQLMRPPQGTWIGISASTLVQPTGLGLVSAELHDSSGYFAQVLQTVMPMAEFKN